MPATDASDYASRAPPQRQYGTPQQHRSVLRGSPQPPASSSGDALEWMRTDIAQAKSALSSMLDSATSRAERALDRQGGPEEFVDHDGSRTRAMEAQEHLSSEVESRIQRLQDLSATMHTDSSESAQGYWRHEIGRLSSENERWRMAVQREHSLMQDIERLHGTQTPAQNATRALIQRGATPKRDRGGVPSTASASASYFPHSSAAGAPDPADRPSNPDALDPGYEPLKFVPSGKKYVSPSLMKLGLSGQLGQGRRTEMSTRK